MSRPIKEMRIGDEKSRRLREQWLRWREDEGKGLTQKDLAELIAEGMPDRVPMSQSTISQILEGKRWHISYEVRLQFARVFGCRIEYLNNEDDIPTVEEFRIVTGHMSEEISLHIKLLECIGYQIKPKLMLLALTDIPLRENWDKIKPTLTEDALSAPINAAHTKTLAKWDGVSRIPNEFLGTFPVRRALPDIIKEPSDYSDVPVTYADEMTYTVEYEVFRDGRRIAVMKKDDLVRMFDTLDEAMHPIINGAAGQHPVPEWYSDTESIF